MASRRRTSDLCKGRKSRPRPPPVVIPLRKAFDMVRGLPPRRSLGPRPFSPQTQGSGKGSIRFRKGPIFLWPSPRQGPGRHALFSPVNRSGTFGLAMGYRFAPSGENHHAHSQRTYHRDPGLQGQRNARLQRIKARRSARSKTSCSTRPRTTSCLPSWARAACSELGEKYRPIPWSVLDYDQKMGGYVVPLDRKGLDNAPAYRMEDLTRHDGGGAIMTETYSYYKVPAYWE